MITSVSSKSFSFPAQKIPAAKRTKKWAKQTMDAAENMALFSDPLIRQSYNNKLTNYNLYNDILDTSDIEKSCNPFGFNKDAFPAKMQNYPLCNPKIDVLCGEERRRRFDWQVQVVNDEAISKKEEAKKEEIKKFISSKINQQEPLNKEELKRDIDRFKSYINYEWQDLLERRATHILNYLYKTRNLRDMFSRGFEDVLIAGEEIYCVDIEGGDPVVRRCNPLNIHTLRSGDSPWIDDADIIIEDGYYSVGQIIDKYHMDLTDKEVSMLEEGITVNSDGGWINIGEKEASFVRLNNLGQALIDTDDFIRADFGQAYDEEGNLRVMRVLWKTYRKVGIVTYYDSITGNMLEKTVDERYTLGEGEIVKWLWISEWWEGTRIGGSSTQSESASLYIKIQKRPIQFRSIHNLSKCHSGYVGLAYNTNVSKAKSLMDRMKPYQYLYNVFMYRTELAFAKAKGRIGKIDLSKMPNGWKVEDWMGYAEINGWLIEDSFNEATKGAAQGKLAGQMSGSGTYLDLDLGNYIQQHVLMLNFIEEQMGQIAGISRQREGQIENRETVRGVERAVSQSNTITEKYFALHDIVKTKVMSILLETAKFAWKGKEKILQYVSDDLTNQVFSIEAEDELMDCDQGVILTSGSEVMELIQSFKELAHAGLQNDKISFKEIMDIYSNPSLVSIRRKVELAEINKQAVAEKQQAQAQEMQTQALEAAKQEAEAGRQFEFAKIDKEYGYKMNIEQMKLNADTDKDDDGIDDEIEANRERTKENIARLKQQSDILIKNSQMNHEKQENEKDRKSKVEQEKIKASAKKNTSKKK